MKTKIARLVVVAAGFAFTIQPALAARCDEEERALDRAAAAYEETGTDDAYADYVDALGEHGACEEAFTPGEIIDFGLGAFDAFGGGSSSHGHSSESYPGHSGRSSDGGFWIGDH
jgi:hypothetical protein